MPTVNQQIRMALSEILKNTKHKKRMQTKRSFLKNIYTEKSRRGNSLRIYEGLFGLHSIHGSRLRESQKTDGFTHYGNQYDEFDKNRDLNYSK